MTKIFVAKLSPETSSESLQALFEQYGEVVSSKVIMDRQTGRSKCYGFVEMEEESAAKKAIDVLDGVDYEGSTISIKEAVPQNDYKTNSPRKGFSRPSSRQGGSFSNGGGGGGGYNRSSSFGSSRGKSF